MASRPIAGNPARTARVRKRRTASALTRRKPNFEPGPRKRSGLFVFYAPLTEQEYVHVSET